MTDPPAHATTAAGRTPVRAGFPVHPSVPERQRSRVAAGGLAAALSRRLRRRPLHQPGADRPGVARIPTTRPWRPARRGGTTAATTRCPGSNTSGGSCSTPTDSSRSIRAVFDRRATPPGGMHRRPKYMDCRAASNRQIGPAALLQDPPGIPPASAIWRTTGPARPTSQTGSSDARIGDSGATRRSRSIGTQKARHLRGVVELQAGEA